MKITTVLPLAAALCVASSLAARLHHSDLLRLQREVELREQLEEALEDADEVKRPYSFAWEASRHYNGAPDREHREERGRDGITRGVFRYVDPSLKVQEVIYTADEDGFHVENSNLPEYTAVQTKARQRHAHLFEKIAEEHVKIGEEHALEALEKGYEPQPYDAEPPRYDEASGVASPPVDGPSFTPVVERAIQRHQNLFEKIAEQHARIAAERETDPADEETGEPHH